LEVTDKVMKDRKILSHAKREKLSRPTQYIIVYNTKKKVMWHEHVQRISHNNWPENVLQQTPGRVENVQLHVRMAEKRLGRTRVDGLERQLTAIISRR